MTQKITTPYFIYSPTGRTGSTILKAWVDSSPDIGPNANERTDLPSWLMHLFAGPSAGQEDLDYFFRREPVYEGFRKLTSCYQKSKKHRFGLKIHTLDALPIFMQIWPDAKVIHSVRNREEQYRSKKEQQESVFSQILYRDQFDDKIRKEELEIANIPNLRIDYEEIPNRINEVFEYLELTPGNLTVEQKKSVYFSRTFNNREAEFDETGWLKQEKQ